MITWRQIFERGEIAWLRNRLSHLFLLGLLLSCQSQEDPLDNSSVTLSLSPSAELDEINLGYADDLHLRKAEVSSKWGIREDIYFEIERLSLSSEKSLLKKALFELALSFQDELLHAHQLEASRQSTRAVIRATDCLYSLVGPKEGQRMRNRIRDLTFNSPRNRRWREVIQQNFEGQPIKALSSVEPEVLCSWIISR